MNRFETYIHDRHKEAIDARVEIESRLVGALSNGTGIPDAVASLALTRETAGWWCQVTAAIEHGDDPVDALWRVREMAHHVLTDQATPRTSCAIALGFATAAIEAARRFYQDTAHLEALAPRTTTGVSVVSRSAAPVGTAS